MPRRRRLRRTLPILEAAYAECREIAKREAKNFYYAFVALPVPRRNAICAIYAFMRQADDLADDEVCHATERRRARCMACGMAQSLRRLRRRYSRFRFPCRARCNGAIRDPTEPAG